MSQTRRPSLRSNPNMFNGKNNWAALSLMDSLLHLSSQTACSGRKAGLRTDAHSARRPSRGGGWGRAGPALLRVWRWPPSSVSQQVAYPILWAARALSSVGAAHRAQADQAGAHQVIKGRSEGCRLPARSDPLGAGAPAPGSQCVALLGCGCPGALWRPSPGVLLL